MQTEDCSHNVAAAVHPASPSVLAELPDTGDCFEGLIPPDLASPAFTIRRPAVGIFALRDYAATGIMSAHARAALRAI
jgi:Flp pilus assembly CpaF family ATPase